METVEWRPGAGSGAWWSVAGVVLATVAIPTFGLPLIVRTGHVVIRLGLSDIVIMVALAAALVVLHEGLHAAVMSVFRARPTFGATLVGHAFPALYTTAPGHVFTRAQYLAVTVTPGISISFVGFAACFTGIGAYLVIPLAMHLGGCIGDAIATWRVMREPRGTMVEDLRDGIRFHRAPQATS